MAKNKEKPDLGAIDAESIIHSFRTTDHLQMAKDKSSGIPTALKTEETEETESAETITPVREMLEPTESPKEETRRRRGKAQDYESLFIREAGDTTVRKSKTVYIREKYHDSILKIVRVIGKDKISLFNYLDNVLEHHFAMFEDEITALYNQKNEGIEALFNSFNSKKS